MSDQRYLEDHDNFDEDDRTDDFFTFAEEEEDYEELRGPLGPKLAAAGIMILASIFAIILLIGGVRTFNEARANEGYEGRSWVMAGTFEKVTSDLQGDNNVAIYTGILPDNTAMTGKTFVSDIADPAQVNPGSTVEFRGSQTGTVSADFPETVDALLVQTDDSHLAVARTGEEGSLVPVTEDTVASQKRSAMLRLAGAILVFGAGVAGTFMMIRKRKSDELFPSPSQPRGPHFQKGTAHYAVPFWFSGPRAGMEGRADAHGWLGTGRFTLRNVVHKYLLLCKNMQIWCYDYYRSCHRSHRVRRWRDSAPTGNPPPR